MGLITAPFKTSACLEQNNPCGERPPLFPNDVYLTSKHQGTTNSPGMVSFHSAFHIPLVSSELVPPLRLRLTLAFSFSRRQAAEQTQTWFLRCLDVAKPPPYACPFRAHALNKTAARHVSLRDHRKAERKVF